MKVILCPFCFSEIVLQEVNARNEGAIRNGIVNMKEKGNKYNNIRAIIEKNTKKNKGMEKPRLFDLRFSKAMVLTSLLLLCLSVSNFN